MSMLRLGILLLAISIAQLIFNGFDPRGGVSDTLNDFASSLTVDVSHPSIVALREAELDACARADLQVESDACYARRRGMIIVPPSKLPVVFAGWMGAKGWLGGTLAENAYAARYAAQVIKIVLFVGLFLAILKVLPTPARNTAVALFLIGALNSLYVWNNRLPRIPVWEDGGTPPLLALISALAVVPIVVVMAANRLPWLRERIRAIDAWLFASFAWRSRELLSWVAVLAVGTIVLRGWVNQERLPDLAGLLSAPVLLLMGLALSISLFRKLPGFGPAAAVVLAITVYLLVSEFLESSALGNRPTALFCAFALYAAWKPGGRFIYFLPVLGIYHYPVITAVCALAAVASLAIALYTWRIPQLLPALGLTVAAGLVLTVVIPGFGGDLSPSGGIDYVLPLFAEPEMLAHLVPLLVLGLVGAWIFLRQDAERWAPAATGVLITFGALMIRDFSDLTRHMLPAEIARGPAYVFTQLDVHVHSGLIWIAVGLILGNVQRVMFESFEQAGEGRADNPAAGSSWRTTVSLVLLLCAAGTQPAHLRGRIIHLGDTLASGEVLRGSEFFRSYMAPIDTDTDDYIISLNRVKDPIIYFSRYKLYSRIYNGTHDPAGMRILFRDHMPGVAPGYH